MLGHLHNMMISCRFESPQHLRLNDSLHMHLARATIEHLDNDATPQTTVATKFVVATDGLRTSDQEVKQTLTAAGVLRRIEAVLAARAVLADVAAEAQRPVVTEDVQSGEEGEDGMKDRTHNDLTVEERRLGHLSFIRVQRPESLGCETYAHTTYVTTPTALLLMT